MSEIIKPATPLPWVYDYDEQKIISESSYDWSGDQAVVCEMEKPNKMENAKYIKVSANLFPKLVELAVEYLECSSALPNFMEREEKIKEILKQCEVENGNS